MKTHLKILSLFLCFIVIITSLISCGESLFETIPNDDKAKNDNIDNSQNAETDDTDNPKVDEAKVLVLFKNGAYTAKFIVPDLASDTEKSVYTKLRTLMKSKTKSEISYTTDHLTAGQVRDPNETTVLLGKTNYEESKSINDNKEYGNYSLNIIGNKIVLSFDTKDDGLELVNSLSKAIRNDGNGTYYVDRSFSISKRAMPQLDGLPKYPSSSTTLVECDATTSMVVANNTTLDDFKGYCSALEQSGFSLYSSRDNVNGNVFRIYVKDSTAINVYFAAASKSARIISGPINDIPTKEVDNTPENVTPSLTILSQGNRYNNGLGMVYLLPNGKFIIIDGGYVRANQLYNILENLAPNEDKITIAAWYMSHPHGDHQQVLTSFLKAKYENVKIESILYNYTTADRYNEITTGADGASSAKNFQNTVATYADKDTKIIKPHSGQIYNYGSASVEILYTVEDVLPKTLDYLNTSSLVVRVTIDNHTMLALADTTHVSGEILRTMYGSYLESEMVQLAHHGTYPGYASLYNTIKAPILIWPSNLQNAKDQITDGAVSAAVKHASDIYIANSGNVTFELPYTPINNKQQFLESIGG